MVGVAPIALGQGGPWFFECIDPENEEPYSDDYNLIGVSNPLIQVTQGLSGTGTYGGDTGPCYAPTSRTYDAVGRLAFASGNTGSVQTSFDNGMAYTMGAIFDPVGDYCYAMILIGGNAVANANLYGDGGLRVSFVGASNRYFVTAWNNGEVDVELQVRAIGDAARLRWRILNLSEETTDLGMLFAGYAALRSFQFDNNTFSNVANSPLGGLTGVPKDLTFVDRYVGWTLVPGQKPIRNERRWDNTNPNFPVWVKFMYSQAQPYGFRLDNVPPQEMEDAVPADLFLIGNKGDVIAPGLIAGNNPRLNVFGDPTGVAESADILLRETAFVQRFPTIPVAPGGFRDIVHYVRSTWSIGDYNDPYTFLLDRPELIAQQNAAQPGVISPNPFTVRAYVDNQFAELDKEVDLRQVQFRITLPDGLSLEPGESDVKVLDRISANAIGNVQWQVRSDLVTFGDLPITVSVTPTPGPSKTLTTTVKIVATPRLRLGAGANLVTIPYDFPSTSLTNILGGLQPGIDYLAFRWQPESSQYVPATDAVRGESLWIVPATDEGFVTLQGAAIPGDVASGGLITTLRQGWNLVGNPYNYPIQIGELVGVSEDNPDQAFTFAELVANGFISASFVSFERDPDVPDSGTYVYTQGFDGELRPHTGYWLFVSTFQPIRLVWPSVFTAGLPQANRSVDRWAQSEREWRLQLSVRNGRHIDAQNFVGFARDNTRMRDGQLPKPPMAPNGTVQLSIEGEFNGHNTRMAQVIDNRNTRRDYKLQVRVDEPGDVTITWPNLAAIPRNIRARLTDEGTGERRDLRATSGYTFRMNEPGTREFTLTIEPGGSSRPVIGNVTVSRPSRDPNSPMTITYALSRDALVTVRVLSSAGREVFTVTRGRSDDAGENSVTWMLRDSANRAVAPGTYQVEILAETPDGDRVRRIVPVNVVR